MSKFRVDNINDLELLYSVLRETYPKNEIEIVFNWNTKVYNVNVTDRVYKEDPEVPVDINIEVVYGDSVTGDTPVILRDPKTHQIYIKTIDDITTEWQEYPEFKMFDQTIRLEKQYGLTHYEVWCDKGWNPIKKVIRHKTNKKIYRVLTHTGVVDVTEDHSLIRSNYEKVKPKDLKVGDDLLHSFPNEFVENEITMVKVPKSITGETKICKTCNIEKDTSEFYKASNLKSGLSSKCKECDYYVSSEHPLKNIMKDFSKTDYILTEDEAKVWGFFVGDGSAGYYKCKSGLKYSWALNNNNMERLNKYKEILERIEPVKFKILDTLKSSGVYKLVPFGSIKYMVDKYRTLFYNVIDANSDENKYKIIPPCILNASISIKRAFFEGYYSADGSKTNGYNYETNPSFATKGKISAQCLYYLATSIGFDMYLQISHHEKKKEMYWITQIRDITRSESIIKKIIEFTNVTTEQFVYDLETEKGIFGAGVGKLQMSNTDSCFLKFKFNRKDFRRNRKDTFTLATLCGDKLTDDIFNRKPIELEFEKVFHPFILLTKKRYIANKYENPKDPFELKCVDAKGIALTRRDYCPMVKKCYKEIIDTIINDESINGKVCKEERDCIGLSIDLYKQYLCDILEYKIDVNDLIVSAMLAASYKTRPVHVQLADKLKRRKEEVQIGDRIPYIFIESDDPKSAKSELGEDPQYAIKNNLKYNRKCYIEQLAKPILGFYKIVLKDKESLLDEIIEYTNNCLVNCGGKRLKPSDFKIEE
jgi:hypothetical protein